MVEHDAVADKEPEILAVHLAQPVGVKLGHGVRVNGMKGHMRCQAADLAVAEYLDSGGLVDLKPPVGLDDGLQQPGEAQAGDIAVLDGALERGAGRALGGQVVYLVGAGPLHGAQQRAGIGHISRQQCDFIVDAKVPQPPAEAGVRAEVAAEDLVALIQEQGAKIGPVLPGYAGYQSSFSHRVAAKW